MTVGPETLDLYGMLRQWAWAAGTTVLLMLATGAALVFWYEPDLRPSFSGRTTDPLFVVDGALRCPVLDPTVIDGDTVRGTIALPWGAGLVDVSIRAANYDAWESRPGRGTVDYAPDELTKGKAAAEALQSLLNLGTLYVEPTRQGGSRDGYGRVLGTLWVRTPAADWFDVEQSMRQNGHVRIEQ